MMEVKFRSENTQKTQEDIDKSTVDAIPRISVIDAKRKLDRGEIVILDIRENVTGNARIKGSIHINMLDIPNNLSKIPRNKEVGIICTGGGRSVYVTKYLIKRGFNNVINIEGGIIRWALEIDLSLLQYI
ncbi:MAG: rhodanese-like domain-containing protein [Candidatus Hodarchaeales archaeon]|jgi:rhodanese-related sulfurtransferase